MWPFKKKKLDKAGVINPNKIFYSQVDITEGFGDNLNLKLDDWIKTIPLDQPSEGISNLPPLNASSDTVYQIAKELSAIRESIDTLNDGVYCPVCHIANIDQNKLHTPCPQCKRGLLKFGWE